MGADAMLGAPVSQRLPDFPWDALAPFAEQAAAYPDGLVDLSVGTPVDDTPLVVQEALSAASDSPGYPQTYGTPALRDAVVAWYARRRSVPAVDPAAVLPTIGSKELVAWLPTLLGLGPGDVVVHPEIAYPTYDVGARLAGATPVPADALTALGPRRVRLVWVNSPSNPTGQVLAREHLRRVVAWARERGAVVASDECYAELGWTAEPVSLLHPDVCDGSHDGLLSVYSLSKQSNLAGYRAAFVAGDVRLIGELLEVRKHAGMIMPAPVQAAMVAALGDDEHVAVQRRRYARRRDAMYGALRSDGWRVDHSAAGLYLWATRDEDCWESVRRLATRGILVAPGAFYGTAGSRHIRVALTASDDQIAVAAGRLSGLGR
jgi:succinyldiaminopimelate transaminase